LEFDRAKYKVQKLPNPMLLHWILNPGLAVVECVFGQRVPSVTLIDKTSDAPLIERMYYPCPSCHALNDARLWTKKPRGNWFGLVCPKCGGKIPCLWNVFSLLLLAVTLPLWIWVKIYHEKPLLEAQRRKLLEAEQAPLPRAGDVKWLRLAFFWGGFMFLFSLLQERARLTPARVAVLAAIWTVGGLLFAGLMKLFLGWRTRRSK
jgi:hypothetical protein